MGNISMDPATGFVSKDELVHLADEPEHLAAAGTPATITAVTAVTGVVVGASAALQGACPTSACTKKC